MSVLPLLAGVAMIGVAATTMAMRFERRRRAGASVAARLELLQSATPEAEIQAQARMTLPAGLERMLARADVDVRLDVLFGGGFALGLAGLVLGLFVNPFAGLATVAMGAGGSAFVLHRMSVLRIGRFVEGLPHLLDAVRQLLIAGYSFQQAFLKAVGEANPDVGRYLDPVRRRILNGASTVEALTWTAERIDNPELHMLATAVRTNGRFGGAIGPILAELSKMLRTRTRVGRELRAATAEIRLSGLVLILLPPAGLAVIAMLNLPYIQFLWQTPQGRQMSAIALGLEVTGAVVMRRLMRLDF